MRTAASFRAARNGGFQPALRFLSAHYDASILAERKAHAVNDRVIQVVVDQYLHGNVPARVFNAVHGQMRVRSGTDEDCTLAKAAVLADFYLGVLGISRRIQRFGGGPNADIRTLGGVGREVAENLPYCRILRKITDGAVGLEHIGELIVLRRAPPVGKRGKRGKSLSDLLPFKMLVNIGLEGIGYS